MLGTAGRIASRGVIAGSLSRINCLGIALAAVAVLAGIAAPGSYARSPHTAVTPATCSYANGWVSATALPTGVVINFMEVDNATGSQSGSVLGISDTGTWSVNVTPPASSTTYEFVSKTSGQNGSNYTVYASCTAG